MYALWELRRASGFSCTGFRGLRLPGAEDAFFFAAAFAVAPVSFLPPALEVRADVPDFFAVEFAVRVVAPEAFFVPAFAVRVVVPAFFAPALEFLVDAPVLAFFVLVPATFAPEFRAAEVAEARPVPLPLPLRAPAERPPLCFRGCVSISKFASSRALRSPLMNPKHSMFPV
ncbi:MAG: hypothetical protein ACI4AL_00675 [Aristaeellaceae bacterium]